MFFCCEHPSTLRPIDRNKAAYVVRKLNFRNAIFQPPTLRKAVFDHAISAQNLEKTRKTAILSKNAKITGTSAYRFVLAEKRNS
jgi:hypothetical protein